MATRRSRSVKLNLDLTDVSVTTAETEATSQCFDEISKQVRFAPEQENRIEIVGRLQDPSLWWQQHEMKEMRAACLLTAYANRDYQKEYAQATVRFIAARIPGDEHTGRDLVRQLSVCSHSHLRGLESYLVPQSGRIVSDQVSRVLQEQTRTRDPKALRTVARKGSRPYRKLARQIACHDVAEALKSSFSSWKEESIVSVE